MLNRATLKLCQKGHRLFLLPLSVRLFLFQPNSCTEALSLGVFELSNVKQEFMDCFLFKRLLCLFYGVMSSKQNLLKVEWCSRKVAYSVPAFEIYLWSHCTYIFDLPPPAHIIYRQLVAACHTSRCLSLPSTHPHIHPHTHKHSRQRVPVPLSHNLWPHLTLSP